MITKLRQDHVFNHDCLFHNERVGFMHRLPSHFHDGLALLFQYSLHSIRSLPIFTLSGQFYTT